MSPVRTVLPLALAIAAAGGAGAQEPWSFGVEGYVYLVEGDDDYLMPIVTADRGGFHLEARYHYEDLDTASAWVGWTLESGDVVSLEVVPMAGVVVGRTDGLAPGLELTLSWRRFELYAESEYVFDLDSSEGDFFYTWSELGWQAWPWLRFGLTAQHTRVRGDSFEAELGAFVGVSRGPVELLVYRFDPDEAAPYLVVSLGVEF
jgi:hypothetical protein